MALLNSQNLRISLTTTPVIAKRKVVIAGAAQRRVRSANKASRIRWKIVLRLILLEKKNTRNTLKSPFRDRDLITIRCYHAPNADDGGTS